MFIIPCFNCVNSHYKHVFDFNCKSTISPLAFEKLTRLQEICDISVSHEFNDRIILKSDIGIIIEYNIRYNIIKDGEIVLNGAIYKELLRYICKKCPSLLAKRGCLNNFIKEGDSYIHIHDHKKYVKITPKTYSYIGLLCTTYKFVGCVMYDMSIKLISVEHGIMVSISNDSFSMKVGDNFRTFSYSMKDTYDEVVRYTSV